MAQAYDPNNIFSGILSGEIPCEFLFEDEYAVAFADINPAAPLHILIIPRRNYTSFHDFTATASDAEIVGFFKAVHAVAEAHGVEESGYRLIANHGHDAMQTVPHFHVHILGKKLLGPLVVGDSYHDA